jgi:4'-phosphopantetheinyl transferase
LPGPRRGALHLWCVGSSELADRRARLEGLLDDAERGRIARFRREEDRACRIVARGALRLVLARYLGVPAARLAFTSGPHGKPALRAAYGESPTEFNIAHSGGTVLIAFSAEGAVGVDVERIRADIDVAGLTDRVFTPAEAQMLDLPDETHRRAAFFRAWTRKEAALKALGTGFSLDPREIEVRPDRLPGHCFAVRRALRRSLAVADLDVGPGFAAAVACAADIHAVHRFSLSHLDSPIGL